MKVTREITSVAATEVLQAYAAGLFPMAEHRHDLHFAWYSANPRAVLPLDRFRCSTSLRRLIRRGLFQIRTDTAFRSVVQACAVPREPGGGTWIGRGLEDMYAMMHALGFTHSVEAWRDGRLVGGLYGMSVGAAFFAESMFHRPDLGGSGASKVCVAHLVAHLRSRGYALLDVQMSTPATVPLGVVEVPESLFRRWLNAAVASSATWGNELEGDPIAAP